MGNRIGWRGRACAAGAVCAVLMTALAVPRCARGEDVSSPAILQMFEARWDTIEDRMADIFEVGYGQMWLPPPQRADTGSSSVGYDVYDRFDLGRPRSETLYGTEASLKASIAGAHNASVRMYTDFIPNHNGFRNGNTSGFAAQGGYPGFVLSTPSDSFGDFHNPAISYEQNEQIGSLFGLLDIAQEKNHQYVRHPIAAGNPQNIPSGTVTNKPDPNNARFYPDQDLGGIVLTDPALGIASFTRYSFNTNDPLAGDPTAENATGLLMRNMQYMIQVIGVDGFRVDAARHMPSWVMNYLDNAVFRASPRTNLDGSIQPIYMFSEVADGNSANVQPYIRRDLPSKLAISPSDTTVRGNRDALDFPLFWKMVENLSSNGTQNNWHRIRGAGLDNYDRPGGTEVWHSDGSQGVTFVDSHDDQSGQRPHLYKVAYAYTLMKPGEAVVYLNAKEFGEGRDFPKDIGGSSYSMSNDALGGYHGDDIAKLVEIRNTHGRGNFQERWIDDAFNPNGFSNIYIYERSNSALVGLNSRLDSGFDQRTPVQTNFAPNTVLVELTGNAANATVDPGGNIPEAIRVNASGQAIVRVPRSSTHGKGYVIYGLATPQGTLSLTNVSQVLAGAAPTQANNGTARLADVDVITADSFSVQLSTTPVTLPAPLGEANPVRDVHADGDLAVIRIDDGLNLNGNSGVDYVTPGSPSYGFENFTTQNSPGYVWSGGTNVGTGSGSFAQIIDTTQLAEGRHYVTVRAFRHRDAGTGGDGGPAVYTDFKRTIYVDRLPPEAALVSFAPYASDPNNPNNRDFIVQSVDQTADSMHVLLDLPANLTDQQVLAQVSAGNKAGYYDRDKFVRGQSVNYGNHVATVVTYEPTGNVNIQRFAGLFTQTNNRGRGYGDMNFSNGYVVGDIWNNIGSVEDVLYSQNSKFSSALDVNGDGLCDNRDLYLLGNELVANGASQSVLDAYTGLLLRRGDFGNSGTTDIADFESLFANFGAATWLFDLNVDGVVDARDAETFVTELVRSVPGDFNVDGRVDAADYSVWRDRTGQSSSGLVADGNFDGIVDDADYLVWKEAFGFVRAPLVPGGGSGVASVAVPEPAVLTLWTLAVFGLVMSRPHGQPHTYCNR